MLLIFSSYLSATPAYAVNKHELEAVYIYNFTNYITWPKNPKSLTICIYGDNLVLETLNKILKKSNKHKSINIQSPDKASDCHIIFIGGSVERKIKSVLKEIQNKSILSILTVSDSKNFPLNGGMIGLAMNDKQISLEINIKNLENAGLKASYKILDMAKIVE